MSSFLFFNDGRANGALREYESHIPEMTFRLFRNMAVRLKCKGGAKRF